MSGRRISIFGGGVRSGGKVMGGCDMINVGGRGRCDVMLRDSVSVVYSVYWQLECGW